MTICLAISLVSFLIPPSLACPNTIQLTKQYKDEIAYEQWRNSLDFSFLNLPYSKCKIERSNLTLSEKEECYAEKLSKRCSAADDCLVQCIGTGMNKKVGGGCWHLCFDSKFKLSEWAEPKGWEACNNGKQN